MPVKIIANGQNFKKTGFNIGIDEISKEEFLEICTFEIKKINKEVKEKEYLFKYIIFSISNRDKIFYHIIITNNYIISF